MVRESLLTVPDGQADVTLPVNIDGLSYIDPNDPAMPVEYVPAGMPHGFRFFPGVHSEEAVAYDVVAKALATPFGR